jgi:hypothetical protein
MDSFERDVLSTRVYEGSSESFSIRKKKQPTKPEPEKRKRESE